MGGYSKADIKIRIQEIYGWIQEVKVESWADCSKDGWERKWWSYSCPETQQRMLSAGQTE